VYIVATRVVLIGTHLDSKRMVLEYISNWVIVLVHPHKNLYEAPFQKARHC
jgi:hypothetical protein